MGGEYDHALDLAVLGAVALAAWCLVLFALAVATRPRLPDPGPNTIELGPESPAVVNLLTSRWQLGREAVPATLLDLAGRRVVDIDEIEPDRFVVRLKSTMPANLTDYERLVFEHVQGLAANGVVPCEALTTGPESASRRWWKTFERMVRADASGQALSRPRWSPGALVLLGVLAVIPVLFAVSAIFALPDKSSTTDSSDNPVFAFLGIGALFWFGLMAVPRSLRADRETEAGLEAASRWLGVREHLAADEIFCDLPPAAVAVWDRYIAYGAALDVSVAAVRALPLGSESEHEAWSAFGGSWHVVRIHYPVRHPPGWGRHPVVVLLSGLIGAAVSFFLLTRALPALLHQRDDILDSLPTVGGQRDAVDTGIGVVALLTIVVFGFVGLRAAVMLLYAVTDLFAREEVTGRILRIREREKKPPLVAVDDARHDEVRAWIVRRHRGGALYPGNDVHAVITPRLAYVRDFEVTGTVRASSAVTVSPSMHDALRSTEQITGLLRHIPGMRGIADNMAAAVQAGVQYAEAAATARPPAPLAGLDVGWAAGIAGTELHDVTATEPNAVGLAAFGGAGEAAVLADGGHGRLVLARWPEAAAFERVGAMLPKFLGREIPGVGTEAVWFARSTLLARDATTTAFVSVALPVASEDAGLALAEQLAARLLA